MLLQNYSYITGNLCGHYHSGLTSPYNFIVPYSMMGYYTRNNLDNIDQIERDSVPTGSGPGINMMLAPKGAMLSSTTTINGLAELTSGLTKGINIDSTINGTSSLSANLSLITSMISSILGEGQLTASLVGIVQLATTINGTSSVTAGLNIIAYLQSVIDANAAVTANMTGTLSMEADIYVNQAQATIDELVAGVWNALTADFNAAGTMGQAMSAAGGAGDPWITTLPGAYTGNQAGAIVDRLEDLIRQVKTFTLTKL